MIDKRELYRLYRRAGLMARIYLRIKLRICPLLALEEYIPSRGRIVDLGCGSGLFSFILKIGSPLREITGLDLDEKKLRLADKIQGRKPLSNFLRADLSQAEFPPAEVYTLIDVLYLIPYPVQVEILSKCYQLLPPGGYILIKEIDTKPRWKYLWNYFQEFLAVKVIGFTLGKKFYFRSSADWSSLLRQLGCHVSVVPLHRGYWYSHVLIIGQK